MLVHGLGAHTGRWEMLSDFFLKHGVSSYAVEMHAPAAYYRDILRIYAVAAKENPKKKIFLVGESLGALVSFLLCIDRPGLFDGLVCISPAFANRIKLAPSEYVKMFASLFYNPGKEFRVPFDSSMCTRDADYRNRMDQDVRESRMAPSGLLVRILLSQFRAAVVKSALRTPVLFLASGEDKIVDSQATKRIFAGLVLKDKTMIEYPDMYHALSIDIGKEKVFEDMLRWVEKRL